MVERILVNYNIRLDPWSPEFGASFQASEDVEEAISERVHVDTSVEVPEKEWSALSPAAKPKVDKQKIAFIDGVRRIEARVVLETDKGFLYGAFGSAAAGAICISTGRTNTVDETLSPFSVRRYLLISSTANVPNPVEISLNYPEGGVLAFDVIPIPGKDPSEPIQALQQLMREEEALISQRLLSSDRIPDLVIADGPLNLPLLHSKLSGYIKSIHSLYIPDYLYPIFYQLKEGQRTPIFLIKPKGQRRNSVTRYSSYIRINTPLPRDTVLAGIVRLEMPGNLKLQQVREMMDACTALIPSFASPYGRDPRAPQNLMPLSSLEKELKRRLGNPGIVKRMIESII